MCGAMEADPFERPYWNLDQYLIWLASRDPAAVLRARPNSGTNPPIGWRVHRESNVDCQKVEMEAVRAIKGGDIKARVRLNRKWKAAFRRAELLATHGPACPMPSLLNHLATPGCPKLGSHWDRCGVHYVEPIEGG